MNRKALKRPDRIQAALREWYGWAQENLKTIVIMGVGLFMGTAVWVLTDAHLTKKQNASMGAYYLANKAFDKRLGELKDSKALVTDMKAELAALESVSLNHPKSKGSLLSLLKVGDFYIEQKRYSVALSIYEHALREAKRQFFKVLVHYNLGYTNEFLNKCDEAIAQFRKITEFNKTRVLFWSFGERPNKFWLSSAYFGIARCYEKTKKFTEAKQSYMQVVDQFPNTQFADQAQSHVYLIHADQ